MAYQLLSKPSSSKMSSAPRSNTTETNADNEDYIKNSAEIENIIIPDHLQVKPKIDLRGMLGG